MSKYQLLDKRVPIAEGNISIIYHEDKCKNCTLCRRACADVMSVLDYYDLNSTGDVPICVHCGQCAVACPFGALEERAELEAVKRAVQDPDAIVIVQTAPAVRVGIGEEFGMDAGTLAEGKMVMALRKLGVDYIVDTNFGADMTIEEEAAELVERVVHGTGVLPQFTSCCPGWVEFAETYFPEYIPNLSTAKSPIGMESAIAKTYFAEKKGLDPKKIVNVVIAPCTAKKFEIRREELNSSGEYWGDPTMRDTDYCLTTREFAKWIREENIEFTMLENSQFDDLIGYGSGGAVIFANTGGVMESAMRTAYHIVTGEKPPAHLIDFKEIRGMEGVKEADVQLGNKMLHIAAVHGGANIRKFLNEMKSKGTHYDFVEMMACRGGCIGGGGQPRVKLPLADKTKMARIEGLYGRDKTLKVRSSFANPQIQALYKEYLGGALSEKAEQLLHTIHYDRSATLGPCKNITPETCPTSPKYKKSE